MGDNKERTLFCGNLSEKVTEELLLELFMQAGPVEYVKIPKDKSGHSKNFGFVTFKHEVSVPYTVALFQGISLYGRELQLDHRTGAGPADNSYMETINAHRHAVDSQRPAAHRRTASYPIEMNPSRNSHYNSNTPTRDNHHDYHPRRIVDRMELPQRYHMNENVMPTNFQVPSYMDNRALQLQTIQAGYGQSSYIQLPPSLNSHSSHRRDHRDLPLRSRDSRKH